MIRQHYWHVWPPSLEYAKRHAHGTVAELGPGLYPFEPATIKVGRGTEHDIDLSRAPLPFDDQSIDFLYCRHTLEDLDDPIHCLREIRRVAKRGWLETPSPMAELSKGVDSALTRAGQTPWRGYVHHKWIFWNDAGTLKFCPKYPAYLEHYYHSDFWTALAHPANWNTYFLFGPKMEVQPLEHEVDFHINYDYKNILQSAVSAAMKSCASYAESFFEK